MNFEDLRGWHMSRIKNVSHADCVVCRRKNLAVHYHLYPLYPKVLKFEHVDLCVRCFGIWVEMNKGLLVARELMGDGGLNFPDEKCPKCGKNALCYDGYVCGCGWREGDPQ